MSYWSFYLGGAFATFGAQVLDSDGRVLKSLWQASIWPIFWFVAYAHELGWLDADEAK